MIRSFLAIETNQAIKMKIASLQKKLKKVKGIKWVNPENIHLTLKFFGDIEPAQVDEIQKAIRPICQNTKPFTLSIGKIGAFPTLSRPRVLWMGLLGDTDKLINFHTSLEKALEQIGFPREGRPFFPHLTMGRIKEPQKCSILKKEITAPESMELLEWNVYKVILFKSQLQPAGAVYTPLWELSLEGGAMKDLNNQY